MTPEADENPEPAAAPEPCGLRETKKRRTREAMHRAAVDLVAEHGSTRVTAEMIAERAGVSPRTFFNYWASKDEAVLGLSHERDARAVELLAQRPAGEDPVASLRAVMLQMTAAIPDDPDLRAAKRAVIEREPHLKQLSGRAMAALHADLTRTLGGRLEAQGEEGAEFRAQVLVQLAVAAARSAFALSMASGRPVAAELERVYAAVDAGAVGV